MKRVLVLLVALSVLAACGIKGEPAAPNGDVPPIPPEGASGGLDL